MGTNKNRSHSACVAVEHMLIPQSSLSKISCRQPPLELLTVMPKTASKRRRTSQQTRPAPTRRSSRASTRAATAASSAVSTRPPPATTSQQQATQAVAPLASATPPHPPPAPSSQRQAAEPGLGELLALIRSEVRAEMQAQQAALATDSLTQGIGQPPASSPPPTQQTPGIVYYTCIAIAGSSRDNYSYILNWC